MARHNHSSASLLKLGFLALVASAVARKPNPKCQKSTIKCPISLDGRVSNDFALETFDTNDSPFNPEYTKNLDINWSEILNFPDTETSSRFDAPDHKAIEVTINDSSIFTPGGGDPQNGFRRAGLLLGNGSDASNVGIQTFHWSVKQDPQRPLNLTHEYMNIFHETNDYSANQWSFSLGKLLWEGAPSQLDEDLYKVLDRENNVIFTTEVLEDEWQNFALTMDIPENTLKVYYSQGNNPLKAVTEAVGNDNTGGGQFQIGLLKKPTGTSNVVFEGYQESGIDEGQIYGGLFIENSAGACVSL
ncbi:hypothetical protein AJ80_02516 [Polytolypa hystricis UAMH7299]|uniref:Glycoside hydrolase 131 catalytic N-terminal domain-containing protein n=1 Tax=Polytolypa hystricis (strain UAMH7299) TaxID=1447883 RepID=A0A2B7YP29_POLH7|nr:hypothetical protein AJ80_02516 [Polytolypa hystricis UAMH7299]